MYSIHVYHFQIVSAQPPLSFNHKGVDNERLNIQMIKAVSFNDNLRLDRYQRFRI